jgi:hypothetical protein
MFHFGYGSNLNIDFVREYLIPDVKFVMKGYLPNFEVRFPFWSEEKQGGYSGIMETPGEMVQGALYEVTAEQLEAVDELDVYKGLYRRETFLVLGEDGEWHRADLYRVIDPQGPFPPVRSYVETMLEGARNLGLDTGYIRRIEGFLSQSQ